MLVEGPIRRGTAARQVPRVGVAGRGYASCVRRARQELPVLLLILAAVAWYRGATTALTNPLTPALTLIEEAEELRRGRWWRRPGFVELRRCVPCYGATQSNSC